MREWEEREGGADDEEAEMPWIGMMGNLYRGGSDRDVTYHIIDITD